MKSLGFANLANINLDEHLLMLCDLRWDHEDLLPQARQAGLWWVAPFARTYSGDLIAVRLQSQSALEPVVLVSLASRNVLTSSSSPSVFIPRQLISTPMNEATWSALAQLDEPSWDNLGRLHKKFGGREGGLSSLRKYVADGTGKAQCAGAKVPISKKKAAVVALMKEIDPGSRGLLDFIQALGADDDENAHYSSTHPAFDAKANSLTFAWHADRGDENEARAAAQLVIRQPLHLDAAGYGGSPSLFMNPAVNALETYRHAAALLEKHPILGSLCKRVRKDAYDGDAHIELARWFRREKQYDDAWHALINAAYFEPSSEAAFTAARELAEEAGWKDIRKALERWAKV